MFNCPVEAFDEIMLPIKLLFIVHPVEGSASMPTTSAANVVFVLKLILPVVVRSPITFPESLPMLAVPALMSIPMNRASALTPFVNPDIDIPAIVLALTAVAAVVPTLKQIGLNFVPGIPDNLYEPVPFDDEYPIMFPVILKLFPEVLSIHTAE